MFLFLYSVTTGTLSCCCLLWSLVWLIILVAFAWPLSVAMAALYGFVSPMISLIGLDDISESMLQAVHVGRECAKNVRTGRSMVWRRNLRIAPIPSIYKCPCFSCFHHYHWFLHLHCNIYIKKGLYFSLKEFSCYFTWLSQFGFQCTHKLRVKQGGPSCFMASPFWDFLQQFFRCLVNSWNFWNSFV